jgi:hypothetical protein
MKNTIAFIFISFLSFLVSAVIGAEVPKPTRKTVTT